MKHETELLPAEVVPTQIITDVVFTPAPSLNAAVEYNAKIKEQRRQEEIAFLKRQEAMRQQAQRCDDCSGYRSHFLSNS